MTFEEAQEFIAIRLNSTIYNDVCAWRFNLTKEYGGHCYAYLFPACCRELAEALNTIADALEVEK